MGNPEGNQQICPLKNLNENLESLGGVNVLQKLKNVTNFVFLYFCICNFFLVVVWMPCTSGKTGQAIKDSDGGWEKINLRNFASGKSGKREFSRRRRWIWRKLWHHCRSSFDGGVCVNTNDPVCTVSIKESCIWPTLTVSTVPLCTVAHSCIWPALSGKGHPRTLTQIGDVDENDKDPWFLQSFSRLQPIFRSLTNFDY